MTIRFKCPNAKCQKALVVKDEQAGKRLRCPACKQPISIPAPVSAPVDLEAFAAAAFADEPAVKKAEPAATAPSQTQTINFTCHYCDAQLHLPAEEGGKNVACPECRKIIKVPALKVERAKDWRDVEKKGPSFARQDEPEKPAGAWDTKATTVGEDVLEEAGVITEPAEPRTLKERLKPYLIVTGLVGLVAVLYFVTTSLLSRNAQKRALDAALAYVDPKGSKTKLPATLAGEVFRGVGEFHLRGRQAEKAREAFVSARANCVQSKDRATTLDRDMLLTDIAINQTELGGSGDEILGGKDRERLEWEEAGNEIDQTLRAITSAEAKAVALAEACRRLLDRGQKDVALGLANRLKINATPGEEGGTPELSPKDFARALLVALLIATDKGKQAEGLLPALHPLTPLTQAMGKALKDDFDGAKKEALKGGKVEDRLRALLAVAAVALGRGKTNEAKPSLEAAFSKMVEPQLKVKAKKLDPAFSFQFMQLAQLMARAGLTDSATTLAEGIPDKAARAHAHLALLLVKLAELAQSGTTAEPKLVDDMVKDKDTLAYAVGQEAVARHNARLGYDSDVLDSLERLEERARPFAHLGIALGIQDRQKK